MGLRIVTDSSCDLPCAVAERLGITIVPLIVNFGAEALRDGVDIQPAQFYQRLKASHVHPTTSQPSVWAFLEVFRHILARGDDVLAIVISSKLSGTYNSALQAQTESGARERITVIDSLQTSLALGLLAQAAASMAKDGAAGEAVAAMIEREKTSLRCYFTVDTLKYLVRGGRATRLQGFLGTLLEIKPVLVLRDGEVHPLERVRTRRRALERLRETAAMHRNVRAMGVCHGVCPNDAEAIARDCHAGFPGVECTVAEFSPVLGVHLGPGALGLTMWGDRTGSA